MVPIELVRRALWKITQGHFDSRIRQHRDDEFERVFSAYNAMADSLEARMLSLHINPGSITGEYSASTDVPPTGTGDSLAKTHEIKTQEIPTSSKIGRESCRERVCQYV